jgi:Mg2+/citrate symporter
MGVNTIFSVLFLAFCIAINVAILWAYRQRRRKQQKKEKHSAAAVGSSNQWHQKNAAAKKTTKGDRIEHKLLLFAVITSIAHALMSIVLVCLIACQIKIIF